MGKHDAPMPLNEALERHYKDEIKAKDAKIAELQKEVSLVNTDIDKLRLIIKEKDALIEEYRNALVEQTLLATARKNR